MGEWSGQLLLNRYRVGERLPGEAETYRAWDAATDKPVNLRRLAAPPEDETRRALEEKARSLGKYLQAGLLPFYGLLEVGAEAFLAEGHVEGPSLSRLNGPLSCHGRALSAENALGASRCPAQGGLVARAAP
jgi:hypothetical protein